MTSIATAFGPIGGVGSAASGSSYEFELQNEREHQRLAQERSQQYYRMLQETQRQGTSFGQNMSDEDRIRIMRGQGVNIASWQQLEMPDQQKLAQYMQTPQQHAMLRAVDVKKQRSKWDHHVSESNTDQLVASSRPEIKINGSKEAKIAFEKLDPIIFAKYVLYYRKANLCPYSGNILAILSKHPETNALFYKVDVDTVDKVRLSQQGLQGVPTIIDRTIPGSPPMLGDQARRWLSQVLSETIRPQSLDDPKSEILGGTPLFLQDTGSLSHDTSSLFENIMPASDTLDPIDTTAVVSSEKDHINQNFKMLYSDYERRRKLYERK